MVVVQFGSIGVTLSRVQENKAADPMKKRMNAFIDAYLLCAGISKLTFMMSGTASLFLPTLKSIRFTLKVPLKVILLPDLE